MVKTILIYAICRIICRIIRTKSDKQIFDIEHSGGELSFKEEQQIKRKIKRFDFCYKMLNFGSNAFLIMAVILGVCTAVMGG